MTAQDPELLAAILSVYGHAYAAMRNISDPADLLGTPLLDLSAAATILLNDTGDHAKARRWRAITVLAATGSRDAGFF